MAVFPGQADDEEAEPVGRCDDAGKVEDERALRLDGDAGKAGGMRGCDGCGADGRQVDAQFLAGLGAFDEHAARLAGERP